MPTHQTDLEEAFDLMAEELAHARKDGLDLDAEMRQADELEADARVYAAAYRAAAIFGLEE